MPFADLRFLVAEDHDFQRRAVVGMLKTLGAKHVVDAGDGNAALDLFCELDGNIDIIVTDLDMPGMDGMELIRHISGAGIPVSMILTSAIDRAVMASVETMLKAYGITLLGAIEKPVTLAKLEAAIERHRPPQPALARASDPPASFSVREITRGLDKDEFEPFFQPMVDIATGGLDGVEALAQWHHPQKGLVAANAFTSAMEAAGLIDDLTWVMLQKSARQRREWTNSGFEPGMAISVNLSLKSLADAKTAERLIEIVRAEAVEPRTMVLETSKKILETTEGAAMTEVAAAIENLARLRMRGFRLAIGDYGTGNSSMEQLTRIAFTDVKIAPSFVASALESHASRVVLESAIATAKKLNMKSVAAGVETRAQFDLLRELGCDIAQGYFIARPMAAPDLPEWSQRRSSLRWWRG